jgi:hypothetical protein
MGWWLATGGAGSAGEASLGAGIRYAGGLSSRPRLLVLRVAACSAWLALAGGVSAAEPWLEVNSSVSCPANAHELAVLIRSQVAGELNTALQVKVTLSGPTPRAAHGRARTLARIEVLLGAESLGVKRLEAARCTEALDAVVAVVALALSSERASPRAASPEDR